MEVRFSVSLHCGLFFCLHCKFLSHLCQIALVLFNGHIYMQTLYTIRGNYKRHDKDNPRRPVSLITFRSCIMSQIHGCNFNYHHKQFTITKHDTALITQLLEILSMSNLFPCPVSISYEDKVSLMINKTAL